MNGGLHLNPDQYVKAVGITTRRCIELSGCGGAVGHNVALSRLSFPISVSFLKAVDFFSLMTQVSSLTFRTFIDNRFLFIIFFLAYLVLTMTSLQ